MMSGVSSSRSAARVLVSCGLPSGFMTSHMMSTLSPPRMGSGTTLTGLQPRPQIDQRLAHALSFRSQTEHGWGVKRSRLSHAYSHGNMATKWHHSPLEWEQRSLKNPIAVVALGLTGGGAIE